MYTDNQLYELWDWRYNVKQFTVMQWPEWLPTFRDLQDQTQRYLYTDMEDEKKMNAMKKRGLPKLCQIQENLVAAYPHLACKNASPANMVVTSTAYHQDDIYAQLMGGITQEAQKESAMNCNTDTRTEAQQAKDYLIKSLRNEADEKISALEMTFNLHARSIENMGELKTALKEGWFKLSKDAEKNFKDDFNVWGIWDFITIENPNRKQDMEGYSTARKAVRAAESDVKDAIVVYGPEKGLEALNAFKAQDFR